MRTLLNILLWAVAGFTLGFFVLGPFVEYLLK
jgi:hypothetical protein